MASQPGRVAIFFWEGYLGIAPSLINGVRELARAGLEVDVVTRRLSTPYARIPDFPPGVRVLTARPAAPSGAAAQRVTVLGALLARSASRVRRRAPEWLKRLLRRPLAHVGLLGALPRFLVLAVRATRGRDYRCFIGVDPLGLVTATALGARRRIPVYYWSLELAVVGDSPDPIRRVLKRLERSCHRRAALTISQDEERARTLVLENRVRPPKLALVPNAPCGPAPRLESDFLQRKFGLPPRRRVLLQIGMLGPDALSLELAREASRWGEDWTLVLHASSRFDEADPYVQRIRRAGNGRTLLSLEPLRYDDLDALVASAHVGLAFYRPALGPHFVSAQASGKLGQYLRCGLPVVCSDFPGLADTVGRYRCGVGVTSVAEVTRAVREVLENYAAYRANAVRCYEEAYEFGAHFRQVVSEIERV